MREKVRQNYCWVIVALCCGLMSASIGIPMNATSVLLMPLAEGIGSSIGDVSVHRTIMAIVTGITAPVAVYLAQKVKLNLLILIGTIINMLAHFVISESVSLRTLYAMAGLIGCGNSVLGVSIISMVINNWFYERRGAALGIPLSCSGIMGALFSPAFAVVLESGGWRAAYKVAALCIGIAALPAAAWISASPEEKGLEAYGKKPKEIEKGIKSKGNSKIGIPLAMLCAANVCASLACCLNTHLSNYATGIGFTTQSAALLVSFLMIGNTGCKLATGILNDRIGLKRTAVIMLAAGSVGAIALAFGEVLPRNCVFAAGSLLGAAYTAPTVMMSIAAKDIFGKRRAAQQYSYIACVGSFVSSLGYSAIGYAYDLFGDYNAVLICAAVLILTAMLLILGSYKIVENIAGGD